MPRSTPLPDVLCIPLRPYGSGRTAVVSADDFWWLAVHEWWALETRPGVMYASRFEERSGRRHIVTMHRSVAGTPDGMETDHANGNTLDNRRANLRPCTHSENMRNRGKYGARSGRSCTSRFTGVSLSHGKWVAGIYVGGKSLWLGKHPDEESAARAYDVAARTHYGAFARLNFPNESVS